MQQLIYMTNNYYLDKVYYFYNLLRKMYSPADGYVTITIYVLDLVSSIMQLALYKVSSKT